MTTGQRTPFDDLLLETKDGEWGEGEEAHGHTLCEIVRGTDFADLHDANLELPRRWIPDHLVERKALRPGDILIETAGGTAKQSTGRTAFLTESFFSRHREMPVLCSSFARHLRVDATKVRPDYLYYFLQALYRAGYMAVFNLQHTGVARFQFTAFRKKTSLELASREAQPKIAAILSAYDDLIANNQRRIALLEGMAEEIYREWFVRMRFPGHVAARYSAGLPEGWTQRRLSEVAEINARSVKRGAEPELIRYIDISAVGTNQREMPEEIPFADAPGRARRIVRSGDILWSSVRPGNKAYCVVVRAMENLVASTGFAVISPQPSIPYTYLHLATTTQNFVDQMVAVAKGAAYPAAAFDDFGRALIIWPAASLLGRFHEVCEPIYEQVDWLRSADRQLAAQRDALLPRLISGKLKVDHLDIRLTPSMRAEAEAVA